MSRNLARKGPQRVWQDGYRNLRVPIAIFDDVKRYLERRKHEYLSAIEGIPYEKPKLKDENDISELIRQTIQQEFSRVQSSSYSAIPSMIGRKKTSKERIKDLLVSQANIELSTIQIGDVLNMPGPTCRQAARELARDDPNIIQFQGRPSRYKFVPPE